ncbi:hypothetical protein P22_0334 [Propionispora sp. 2/2-37]|uniref:TraR/DksA C4-type zinc finger protein n=1 Tax=Propionispora sp. 2/2-37 TaxID=1677858 RepID=UPI0006BB57F3|nr:TraR/DksA C4-type zinc finger protein [Propionispora sp. 2/2-37]CUH94268.1 hypothetical protein P22_0334 [Propionispora sp. 2/2-37]
MDQKELTKIKQRLLAEKSRLEKQISHLEENGLGTAMSDSISELSTYDNHPADIGDELFERSKDIALRDNEIGLLEAVDRALHKITQHTYGICDTCGGEISSERLQAIPWASQCIACQRKGEPDDPAPRPIEEELLTPPFHRTFLDRKAYVGFDGEDTLQAVLKYGSSDSPQDIPGSYNYKALFPNSNEHQGIVEKTDALPDQNTTNSKRRSNT